MVLGLKEGLVECATVCLKSEVIINVHIYAFRCCSFNLPELYITILQLPTLTKVIIFSHFFSGTLKIAEVVSRFKDLNFEDFLQLIAKYGFQVQRKDTSNEFFYLVDLKKVAPCKKKPPEFKLKPCLYKKR